MQITNPFRESFEWYSTVIFILAAFIVILYPHYFLLSTPLAVSVAGVFFIVAVYRYWQGWQVHGFQTRLLQLKVFSYSTQEVPLFKQSLYVGLGFEWKATHTQRKSFINNVLNDQYQHKGKFYNWARDYETTHHNLLSKFLHSSSFINPVRPLPDIGGKPWLHGLNETEKPIGILEGNRNGHMLVIGTTRVGKTRLLSNFINQDIRRNEAVIILDPKGDLEMLRDIYAACAVSGRLDDLKIVHVGFPKISACLNTLASYSQIAEVATRVTSAIPESGEGATFKKFAWKYVNIVAQCLVELEEPINYERISFYVTRPEALLVKYADKLFSKQDPHYWDAINDILKDESLVKNKKETMSADIKRSFAVKKYVGSYIETSASKNDVKALVGALIVPLYEAAAMDTTYYQKITASVGPVLDQINQSPARSIFSFEEDDPRPKVKLIDAIKRKQVVYIGLNSLENSEVSSALGKAIISDLVSCAGKIYLSGETYPVSIYCDEFSEIVQQEFVTLANKSGGAGFRIIAATQTINDLSAILGNKDKAKQLEGNFQTMVIMRVRNEETANLIINQLPEVDVMTYSEGSSSSELQNNDTNIHANMSHDTRMSAKTVSSLHVNDIISLPKGHAFVLTNGGQLYKVRIPLPKADDFVPKDFVELIEQVNVAHEKN